MAFYIRNYSSEEKYDISKFMEYKEGVYDTIGSPFLAALPNLTTTSYYNVDDGFREIDLIASEVYGDQFFAYLIQYYNGDFRETFPEGTVLRMFSAEDLAMLYDDLSAKQKVNEAE